MLENSIKSLIGIALAKLGNVWTFSNPRGVAWMGKLISHREGMAVIAGARRVEFGLDEGSSDLIGFVKVRITPEMVGKDIAIFFSPEIKRSEDEKPKKHQREWIDFVNREGGIAFSTFSEQDAINKLYKALAGFGAKGA